jgi:hypothetical protein
MCEREDWEAANVGVLLRGERNESLPTKENSEQSATTRRDIASCKYRVMAEEMSNWLLRKDLCQRCFSGIDDDGDGNCGLCARLSDNEAQFMKMTRFNLELAELDFKDSRTERNR